MRNSLVLGVDIGGSHITTSLIDMNNGVLLPETQNRQLVDSSATHTEIIDAWTNAIRKSLAHAANQRISVGIAMPGPFDYENGLSLMHEQEKFRSLYQRNVRDLLSARLDISGSQIHFLNDACAFLQGEVVGGSLRDRDHVMGITLGTGLGSAFYRNGVVRDADLWCMPYRDGIAEDYLSTRWFTSRYFELTGQEISGVKQLISEGIEVGAREQVFREFAATLGEFMKQQYLQYDYDTIVIGGNISRAGNYFQDQLLHELELQVPGKGFVLASLGETAALLGAGGYAFHRERLATRNMA